MLIGRVGHLLFALTLIALGLLGLITGDFTAIWEPVPKGVPARELLVYVCALISLASGVGLLLRRTAAPAAACLLAYLLIWFVLFRLPVIFHAPLVAVTWEGCGETAVVIAAAWALYAWFAASLDRRHVVFVGENAVHIARGFYGLAVIAFGLAHFAYVKETASLIPEWLPWHVVWVYVTGYAYIAAGIAVLTGVCARAAAALSALQMGLFTVLVWVPTLAAGGRGHSQWSETLVSWTLAVSGWVVADSYRDLPWFNFSKPRIIPSDSLSARR